jgi:amino-acid N-acetyltransferase
LATRREAAARQAGVGALYLLTTTAADYFRLRGYSDVARAAVPPAVAGHAQFRSLCPASATCLRKEMEER